MAKIISKKTYSTVNHDSEKLMDLSGVAEGGRKMSIEQLRNTIFAHVLKILPLPYFQYAEQLERQITFEMIKKCYIYSSHKSASTIYQHCGGSENDESIKRYSRYLKYADYYRAIFNNNLKDYTNDDFPDFTRQPMTKREDHFKGVYLSESQFLQLDCIYNIPLLKDIISKRITNVKNINNSELHDKFDEYRKKLLETEPQESDEHSYLIWIFNLFSLESRYYVLSVYKAASLLSKYNNSNSKEKFSDEEKATMLNLFRPIIDKEYIIENTMLPIRLKIIDQLKPGNVNNYTQLYINLLKLKSKLKDILILQPEVNELLSALTLSEMCKFINKEYDISRLLEPDFEWSSKKELFVREIYENIIMDYPAPPIK